MMNDKEMEDGECSSGEEEPLFQYQPLQRPTEAKKTCQQSINTKDDDDDEYDSDHAPPGLDQDSDSDSDSEFKKTKPKQSRNSLWSRRDALVPDDGGGDEFKKMAQAYQAQRDAQGLNKKKKRNNIWGSFIQEESLNAEISKGLGVGQTLKDLNSDRGAETYDFTQIIKEKEEERRKQLLEAKKKKNTRLDDEMESYWNKKDDEVEENDVKEEAEEMETVKEEKRGTKRSVKDRLGDKKMRMDRYHGEVLPSPGQPRQIVDIPEESLVEGTDDEFGEEVASRLQEEKPEMIIDLVKILGRRKVWEFFKEVQAVEGKGGMMINNGARRRTAGGVLMYLMRNTEDEDTAAKAQHYFRTSQNNERKRRVLQAKSKKKKKFEDEMQEFLKRKQEIAEDKNKEQEDDMEEEEELKPLPNILSMIANSLSDPGEDTKPAPDVTKVSVGRVASFKEPEAPPNSVERVERNIIDYDDDDFLNTNNETEDIELF